MRSRIPGSTKINIGKLKVWDEVARDMLEMTEQWMKESGLTEQSLKTLLASGSFRIQDDTADDSIRSISIIRTEDEIGDQPVGLPLVWDPNIYRRNEFRVTISLLLESIARRFGGDGFRDTVDQYAKKF